MPIGTKGWRLDGGFSHDARTHVRRPICLDLWTIDRGGVVGARFGVGVGTKDALAWLGRIH
jgi:hypothetical protein